MLRIMEMPITSEVPIENGVVLKEIATGQLFEVVERIHHGQEVSGEDDWKISPLGTSGVDRLPLIMSRNELSEKFFFESDGQ